MRIILLIFLIILSSCSMDKSFPPLGEEIAQEVEEIQETEQEEIETAELENVVAWKNIPLKNVVTGEEFTINDFKGQKVLMESFAVWCPLCLKQQQELKKVKNVVHISLDTDPNEDAELVKEHVNRYGFDWSFAISPPSLTQSLIDEFGISIVNAPGIPVVLICEDGQSRMLKRGIKPSDELEQEISKGC